MAPPISPLQHMPLRLSLRALFSTTSKLSAPPPPSSLSSSIDETLNAGRRTTTAPTAPKSSAATANKAFPATLNSLAPQKTSAASDQLLKIVRSSSSKKRPPKSTSFGKASKDLFDRITARQSGPDRIARFDEERQRQESADYLTQMPRRFKPGDLYSPHDLSPAEMSKYRRRPHRSRDVVDALGINPLDHYKNFTLLSQFTSSSGQVLKPELTGLRSVNQRKVAKMIRRAQGMGIYPKIHAHPEMLRQEFYPETARSRRLI
ncbi:hypothetical protein CDD82_4161 [Ophiocordyceps australis]|uniref:Small ribosomal subunit protein bS18m n=1 Tax=Ophiocordyceps australis TaxID=1399860 RepID=A0A2C5Z864_9HYPO|nr:hypothetical protein CDD82_4161 [Ophiocordyceps australis]